jgi:alpha-mannosidase
MHSTPEAYFAALPKTELPSFAGSMNPMMIGCYTSQVLIKQAHRQLENMLFSTEKLVSAMELQLGKKGDWSRIREAEQALLFSQFHDILPGSSVKRAEEASLRSLHYGLELLNRERMKAFMAFASIVDVQKQEGDIPILVMNTHPYPVRRVVQCEFQLQDQNRSGTHTMFEVYHRGQRIPAQLEKEDSTIPIDWRKKLLFETELAPFEVSVIVCRPVVLPQKPLLRQMDGAYIEVRGGKSVLRINKATGLLEMTYEGKAMLRENSARLMVIQGSEDPWGMRVSSYPDVVGQFTLVDAVRAGEIAGLQHPIAPVRIIEQGDVRTVVEGIYTYQHSAAIVHYGLEHATGKLEITVHLQWLEPDKMVKLSLLPTGETPECLAQDLFGRKRTGADGAETVAQQWVVVKEEEQAFAVLNTGSYAHDFACRQLNLTLLHSPAYCAHPVEDWVVLPQDRWLPRVDMGERSFRFVLCPGKTEELLRKVEAMAQQENEQPFALSFFPSGESKPVIGGMTLDNESILLSAMTKIDTGYLIRLFNPLEEKQIATLKIPAVPSEATMRFTPFEVKTLLLRGSQLEEVLLDGNPKPEGGVVYSA